MSKGNGKRLLELMAYTECERNYRLYVKDGEPIRIMCETPCESTTIYPEDGRFDQECKIIIAILSEYKNLKQLKRLYNALEDGRWKKYVKNVINRRIDYFEKGLAILKS